MTVDPIDPRRLGDELLGKTSIDLSILARLTEGSGDELFGETSIDPSILARLREASDDEIPPLCCDESQSSSSAFVSEADEIDQDLERLTAIQQRQEFSKDMLYGSG